jgi:hypothetical protein
MLPYIRSQFALHWQLGSLCCAAAIAITSSTITSSTITSSTVATYVAGCSGQRHQKGGIGARRIRALAEPRFFARGQLQHQWKSWQQTLQEVLRLRERWRQRRDMWDRRSDRSVLRYRAVRLRLL